jgi:hypothetical protein
VAGGFPFIRECPARERASITRLLLAEYEYIRADGRRFFVNRRRRRYGDAVHVVRKREGGPQDLAAALNPRS